MVTARHCPSLPVTARVIPNAARICRWNYMPLILMPPWIFRTGVGTLDISMNCNDLLPWNNPTVDLFLDLTGCVGVLNG